MLSFKDSILGILISGIHTLLYDKYHKDTRGKKLLQKCKVRL